MKMQASKMNLRREFIKEYIQNVYNSVVRHMDPSTKKKKEDNFEQMLYKRIFADWLIHVDIWQKRIQHCKVIILHKDKFKYKKNICKYQQEHECVWPSLVIKEVL